MLCWQRSRTFETGIKEYKYNLTQSLLEKSKLAQHVYEEGHKICWEEVKVLQTEPNTTDRKYMESAHMSLIDYVISQSSLTSLPSRLQLSQQKSKTTTMSNID
jgi:hypothetical protein